MDRDPQRAGSVDGEEMSDVDTSQTNHLSFCAGYGGIDLALKSVVQTCRTVAYVEIEAFAIANLVAKMEAGELDQAPIWTDVKTFPAEKFHGLVDIVSGGYPCQPFSAAGKRLGTEDPRHLWPFLRGAIRSIRPGRVFLENVEGHISLGLSTVISDLDEDGYRATWGIFSAAECNAPHQRKRVFIMADSRCVSGEVSVGWKQSAKPIIGSDGEARRTFPAGPGQPQFDWEEPRTVADPKSGGTVINEEAGNRGERIGGGSEEELADSPGIRPKRFSEEAEQVGEASCRGRSDNGSEELGDPRSAEPCGLPDEARKDVSEVGDANRRQTESELGGTTDGRTSGMDATANRVDRLRLLGNGVVPATAAKAWTVLSGRFE